MAVPPKEKYDAIAHRFVVIAIARRKSKTDVIEATGWSKSHVNFFEKGDRAPPDILDSEGPYARFARLLGMSRADLTGWLADGDESCVTGRVLEKIREFESRPLSEQMQEANDLGWWKAHGRPPKQPPR